MKVDYKTENKNNQSLSTTNLSQKSRTRKSIAASNFTVRSDLFFELFPFHIIFKKSLEIISVGEVLSQAMKNIEGESLRDLFNIVRPMVHEFNWENVIIIIYMHLVILNLKYLAYYIKDYHTSK